MDDGLAIYIREALKEKTQDALRELNREIDSYFSRAGIKDQKVVNEYARRRRMECDFERHLSGGE